MASYRGSAVYEFEDEVSVFMESSDKLSAAHALVTTRHGANDMADVAYPGRLPKPVKQYNLIVEKGCQCFFGLHPKQVKNHVELTVQHVGINPGNAAQ